MCTVKNMTLEDSVLTIVSTSFIKINSVPSTVTVVFVNITNIILEILRYAHALLATRQRGLETIVCIYRIEGNFGGGKLWRIAG